MSADGTIPEARREAATSQWFTPSTIVEPARAFLGTIDLDPASCEVANRTVQADVFYAERGIESDWYGGVFCNPPSPPRPWWARMRKGIEEGRVRRAVFVGYSIEVLQQFQERGRGGKRTAEAKAAGRADATGWLQRWHVCIPSTRITYDTTAWDRMGTLNVREWKAWGAHESARGTPKEEALFIAAVTLHQERARLAMLDPQTLVSGDAPAHASAILGYGDRDAFHAAFADVGVCK